MFDAESSYQYYLSMKVVATKYLKPGQPHRRAFYTNLGISYAQQDLVNDFSKMMGLPPPSKTSGLLDFFNPQDWREKGK